MIHIRPPSSAELAQCVELNNSSLLSENSNPDSGFLLSKISIEQLTQFDKDGILRVAIVSDQVAGFILAFKRGSNFFTALLPLMEHVDWLDSSIPAIEKFIYVYKKVVAPASRRCGIASAMYRALLNEFPDFGLLGATVEKPVANEPSLLFRAKNHYRRVGTFCAPEFDGLKNYQSGLYYRPSTPIKGS